MPRRRSTSKASDGSHSQAVHSGGGAGGGAGAGASHGSTATASASSSSGARPRKRARTQKRSSGSSSSSAGGVVGSGDAAAASIAWRSGTVVVDNGGGTIKAGWAGDKAPTATMHNCTAWSKRSYRVYVGDQIDGIMKDAANLVYRRSCDRGYIVNFASQEDVWHRLFSKLLHVDCSTSSLLLTSPLFAPHELRRSLGELIFETFAFKQCVRKAAAELVLLDHTTRNPDSLAAKTGCAMVVDSGFSFSHAYPVVNRGVFASAVKRLNVGGKALTNLLKETVSYRHWNMMEDTLVVNHVKESLCFVSQDLEGQLHACDPRSSRHKGRQPVNSALAVPQEEYILPDFQTIQVGYVKGKSGDPFLDAPSTAQMQEALAKRNETAQVLRLNNERFTIPEALFRPQDIGLHQAGIAETAAQAFEAVPVKAQAPLIGTVLLAGGNVAMPGFHDRMVTELRAAIPDDLDMTVVTSPEPALAAWRGGSLFASSSAFTRACVDRKQWLELGPDACLRKYGSYI